MDSLDSFVADAEMAMAERGAVDPGAVYLKFQVRLLGLFLHCFSHLMD